MLFKELASHLLVTLVWLSFLTLIRFKFDTGLIYLWAGGLIGTYLLDLDHIFNTLLIYPNEPTNIKLMALVKNHQFKEALILLTQTDKERTRLTFHNAIFQVFLLLLTLFILSSTQSLLGRGLMMAMCLHLLKDEAESLLHGGEENLI